MASPRDMVLEDCLEYIGRRVVYSDGLLRLQYFQQFEELYQQYQQEDSLCDVTYGRLYNLSEITEFLVILTQAARAKNEEPYEIDAPPGKSLIPKTDLFDIWQPSDWKSLRESLVKIQTSMLRRDANASIAKILTSDDGESKEIDPSRSHDPWFTDKLFKVLDLFKLHEKLAPFREELETRSSIADGDDEEALKPLSLPKSLWNDFMDMVDGEEERRIKKAFLSLLKNDQSETFHSPATIRRLLDDPSQPHSFAFFLNRVNKLMRAWASQVLENPTTTGINLSSNRRSNSEVLRKTDSGQTRALKKLQRSRARLNEQVEDPLSEAVAAADKAKRQRKRKQREPSASEETPDNNDESNENFTTGDRAFAGRTKIVQKKVPKIQMGRGALLEKKKSATRLSFTPEKESDSEDIEDPKEDDEVLSDVKKRAKITSPSPSKKLKSQTKMYEGRRMWTDSEKNALIQGIDRFGIGHWAEIKKAFYLTLKFRTSGQIKDKYRTMKKRGELDDLVEASPTKDSLLNDKEGEETEEGNDVREEEEDKKEEEKDEEPNDSNEA